MGTQTPKQRFEKMVEQATCSDPGMKNGLLLGAEDIVTLLLREHRRTLRMIECEVKKCEGCKDIYGARRLAKAITTALKGTP